MERRRVVVVIGTRPEAVKLAPVVALLAGSAELCPYVVTTGQQRRPVDEVLELFDIEAEADLGLADGGATLSATAAAILGALGALLPGLAPAVLLTQGDTTSTLAAALAGFYTRVPVVHLEAGLRSDDPDAPYPEEANRRMVAALAGLHLAPTPAAVARLHAEGADPASVVLTGNTVVDALLAMAGRGSAYADPRLTALDAEPGRRVVLVTAHRRESWGPPLTRVAAAVEQVARDRPGVLVVVTLHPNPAARRPFLRLAGVPGVLLVGPQPYDAFLRLLRRADLVLTDSGGVQEEAPSLGTPVLVLRDRTERTEGVAAGLARLVGTDAGAVHAETLRLLDDPAALGRMSGANPYGDGRAAARAVAAITGFLRARGQPAAASSSSRAGATTCR